MTEKTTYTLSEAAALLNCHAETLRRAVRAGHLRGARIGRGYRFSRQELEIYWAAMGGGALFQDSPPAAGQPVPSQGRRKKPGGPEQLKLPT